LSLERDYSQVFFDIEIDGKPAGAQLAIHMQTQLCSSNCPTTWVWINASCLLLSCHAPWLAYMSDPHHLRLTATSRSGNMSI
jgi:hypothetical protein